VKLALLFRDKFGHQIPLAVDLLENEANVRYAAWPERIYVLHRDRILLKGRPGPTGYVISDLEDFLSKWFQASQL